MKFQFMSMSLGYFSSLNMMKNLREINAETTTAAIASSADTAAAAAAAAAAANIPTMKHLKLGAQHDGNVAPRTLQLDGPVAELLDPSRDGRLRTCAQEVTDEQQRAPLDDDALPYTPPEDAAPQHTQPPDDLPEPQRYQVEAPPPLHPLRRRAALSSVHIPRPALHHVPG